MSAVATIADELKPGQKYPTPTPGFGDRVFYETLLRQRPESAMAQEWCVNYGVLDDDEAAELYQQVMVRKKRQRGAAVASPSPKKKKKKKSKIVKEEGHEPELHVGGIEGMGTTTL